MHSQQSIGIFGAGAWGTALAHIQASVGRRVYLWARSSSHLDALRLSGENAAYLPGVKLAPHLIYEPDLSVIVRECSLLLAVVPAQALRSLVEALVKTDIPKGTPLVICAKGIERGTSLFMSDVVESITKDISPALLSGPSFAADVVRGLPTAVTLTAHNLNFAGQLAAELAVPNLRIYHTDDIRGVEIGGAVKNVLAIACGIALGRGLGASAHAALVARGFAEMLRFGQAYGARAETFMGLSGLGDLVLTCGSAQSRNFSLGFLLGEASLSHREVSFAQNSPAYLTEGAFTASVLVDMALQKNIDLPICTYVHAILNGSVDIASAIEALLSRPQRAEG